MKPLHEELKEIRLEKGISLEDISHITKIRVHLLENLEKGDFSMVPIPYIRAFLREYAEVIGVDPARVIAKLENKITGIRDEQPPGESEMSSSGDTTETERNGGDKPELPDERTGTTGKHPQKDIDTSKDISEAGTTGTGKSVEETPSENQLDFTQTPEQSAAPQGHKKPEDDEQPSLFSATEDTTADIIVIDSIEPKTREKSDTLELAGSKKPLSIEESKSTNIMFFVLFFLLIIIAAIIIVWIT